MAILSRTQSKLDAVAEKYAAKGKKVVGYSVDLTQPETVPAAIERITAELGRIDVAIYNAVTVRGIEIFSAKTLIQYCHSSLPSHTMGQSKHLPMVSMSMLLLSMLHSAHWCLSGGQQGKAPSYSVGAALQTTVGLRYHVFGRSEQTLLNDGW